MLKARGVSSTGAKLERDIGQCFLLFKKAALHSVPSPSAHSNNTAMLWASHTAQHVISVHVLQIVSLGLLYCEEDAKLTICNIYKAKISCGEKSTKHLVPCYVLLFLLPVAAVYICKSTNTGLHLYLEEKKACPVTWSTFILGFVYVRVRQRWKM